MKKEKIFVLVSLLDEIPDSEVIAINKFGESEVGYIGKNTGGFSDYYVEGDYQRMNDVTHFLKEKKLYTFTTEELKEQLSLAFNEGKNIGSDKSLSSMQDAEYYITKINLE